jgi:hypothetical protein
MTENQIVAETATGKNSHTLSDRLSDKHVARLVQYLALTVINAAASAST